ncbi:hypothetical protein MUB24_04550 [Lederbergia sp. NSJ-179]|uniref:hypothetical protein n=1 Tax=Lederbergia sp. NSJ-179 TaxID=2931402 RepID=UPI001FD57719|nr:hypothetical protein [Lederbergia sp. NSJ-179]MCJ7840193.1 hypothetical protein [Lederbergia sp. NSJ-179]
MSQEKKPKEIHVENLVIHAKNVEINEDRKDRGPQRDPWGFFWGRSAEAEEEVVEENPDEQ